MLDAFIHCGQMNSTTVSAAYAKILANYTFSNDIPKNRLYVRLSSSISSDRRNFISNSIREFFKD